MLIQLNVCIDQFLSNIELLLSFFKILSRLYEQYFRKKSEFIFDKSIAALQYLEPYLNWETQPYHIG